MWIKICGIRDVETAAIVADAGANAVGLNFYEGTPRCISIATATSVVESLSAHSVTPVGLFVNHAAADICSICQQTGINTVQIHGDEPPELLAELQELNSQLRIIRAFRFGDNGINPLKSYLNRCRDLDVSLWACLVDSHVKGTYGGTGTTLAWERLHAEYVVEDFPRLILAGGLNPDNIADAIKTVRPWGIDTASGVESSPAEKDRDKVIQFLSNAKNAFAEIGDAKEND